MHLTHRYKTNYWIDPKIWYQICNKMIWNQIGPDTNTWDQKYNKLMSHLWYLLKLNTQSLEYRITYTSRLSSKWFLRFFLVVGEKIAKFGRPQANHSVKDELYPKRTIILVSHILYISSLLSRPHSHNHSLHSYLHNMPLMDSSSLNFLQRWENQLYTKSIK